MYKIKSKLIIIMLLLNSIVYGQDSIIIVKDTISNISWNEFFNERFELLGKEFNYYVLSGIDYNEVNEKKEGQVHFILYRNTRGRGDQVQYHIVVDSTILTTKEKDSLYNNNIDKSMTFFYKEVFTRVNNPNEDLLTPGCSYLFVRVDNGNIRYIVHSKGYESFNTVDKMTNILDNKYIQSDYLLFIKLLNISHKKTQENKSIKQKKCFLTRKK